MHYAILCYDDEATTTAWDEALDAAVMRKMEAVQRPLAESGRLGTVVRLMPTSAATSVRKGAETLVLDGPFAETKEQLLGFFVVECDTLDEAVAFARALGDCKPTPGTYEIRPIALLNPVA